LITLLTFFLFITLYNLQDHQIHITIATMIASIDHIQYSFNFDRFSNHILFIIIKYDL